MFTFFFFWKTPKAGILMQGAWSPCGKAVLQASWLHGIANHHILYKVGLENVSHLLQWTHNLSRTLGIVFKCSFLFVGSLRVSRCFIIGSFPLFKEALQRQLFYSFWLGLVCVLTKTVTETSVQCGKQAWMEVVNKIMGRPCGNYSKCQILTYYLPWDAAVQLKYTNSLATRKPATTCA